MIEPRTNRWNPSGRFLSRDWVALGIMVGALVAAVSFDIRALAVAVCCYVVLALDSPEMLR